MKPYLAIMLSSMSVLLSPAGSSSIFIDVAAARADADEASLHGGLLVGGVAMTTRSMGPADLMPTAGLSGALTYAISDWYAFEARVELEHSAGLARFDDPEFAADPGQADDWDDGDARLRRMGWFRGEAGISARLGVRWIPTLHTGLGVQAQLAGPERTYFQGHTLPGPGHDLTVALIGVVGAGMDYRLDEHWLIGGGVRARRALHGIESFGALSVTVHVGYCWYPRNMAR